MKRMGVFSRKYDIIHFANTLQGTVHAGERLYVFWYISEGEDAMKVKSSYTT